MDIMENIETDIRVLRVNQLKTYNSLKYTPNYGICLNL